MFGNFVFDLQRFANIYNTNSNTLLSGTSGNDTIFNGGYIGSGLLSSFVRGGSNVTIKGGAGNDSISNGGTTSFATIDGGNGNDSIYNVYASLTAINGGEGNDSIRNYNGDEVSIDGGSGNDTVYNDSGDDVTINTGAGNDSINNASGSEYVIINSGAGNDTILNKGFNNSINAGSGDDYIDNNGGNDATITASKGNDTIRNFNNSNVLFKYSSGDGDDIIYGFNETSTLRISGASYSTQASGNDILVKVGNNTITLKNIYATADEININGKLTALKRKTIEPTDSNDEIYIFRDSVTVDGGAGNDYIYNYYGQQASIAGGAGNDSIWNGSYGSLTAIDGGTGNDFIYNYYGNKVSINGGAGNDKISLSGTEITAMGGTGNDSISSNSGKVTIIGGEGNDTINTWGSSNLLIYRSGDGNDLIRDFTNLGTLSIAGGNYSTATSGYDVLITVGDGVITLKNAYATAANTIHINKESIALERKAIKLTNSNDTITISRDSISVNALGGNDYIENYGPNVTITGGAGNDYISNNYDSVTIDAGTGNDTISNWSDYVLIDLGAGNDYIDNYKNSTINGGTGDDSIYNSGDYSKIVGGAGNDFIYNSNWYGGVIIDAGAGNDSVWNDSYSSLTAINSGSGNDSIENRANKVTINAGTGNDFIKNNSSEGYGKNILFKYASGEGNDLIQGFNSTSTLSISGSSYSTTTSGNDIIVTVGKGEITLIGAASLSAVNITGEKSYAGTNSWKLSGTTATYGTSSKTLVTVSGVKSTSEFSLSGKVLTIAASALNKSKVTISDGYTLALASDVAKTAETSNAWTFDKKKATATCKQTNSAYYSLAGDKKSITFKKATSKNLVTVSGVKSASGLSLNKKVVTVAAAALNKSKVTISDGYTLKLADDVPTPKSTAADWIHDGTKATYKSSGTTAGYTLANNSITYSTAKTASTLATITGVKSTATPAVKGKVITLKKANLSSNKVTVSGSGYEFNFAKGDYKKTSITGSSKADTITSNGSNLSITGGKGNDVINLASTANKNTIVYKSGDGKDTIKGLTEDDTLKIASGTAKVTTSGADVIFTVGKGKITVKDAADKTFTYIASGVKETYSPISAEPYTINGAAIVLSSSYNKKDFDVAEYGEGLKTVDASAVTHELNITGNDKANKIVGGKGNDTLDGFTGNDTLTGGDGADIFICYEGDGNDIITDYTAKDTIAIEDGEVIPTVKGRDVVLNVGEEKITAQNAAKNKIGVTYTENGVEYDYLNGEQTVILNEKKTSAVVTKNYWKNSLDMANFGKSIITADATSITHELKITGNDKANKILGGSNKNTLAGGGGNDTLQGGDKADVFIYNKGDGNDIIYGYGEDDIISVTSGAVNNVKVKGDTVILTVGKGKISIEGAVAEATNITYYDENGRTSKIYSKENTNVVEPLWRVEDDDNFVTGNELGAIIQSDSVDYSFLSDSTRLTEKNNLVVCSNKK